MGKLELYKIVFDNPVGVFYAGQSVNGKVIVQLNAAMNMKGVFIHFQGKAEAHWSDKEDYFDYNYMKMQTKVEQRNASEWYFDIKKPLDGTESQGALSPGEHQFTFSMSLPAHVPASFEGKFGSIRYLCSSNISRPWRFDPKCKAAFTVVSTVDLNQIPNAGISVRRTNTLSLGLTGSQLGLITASVVINKLGFVPGESIFINADISNQSDKAITRTFATLKCNIFYQAQYHSLHDTKVICRIQREGIQPHSGDRWANIPMKIPPIPATGCRGCQIIRIEYFLEFSVFSTELSPSSLLVPLPVVIGTIPLLTDFTNFVPPMTTPLLTLTPPTETSTSLSESSERSVSAPLGTQRDEPPQYDDVAKVYPDLPPPSYEEYISGKVNIRDDEGDEYTSGELEFAPRYTYYNPK